MRTLSSTIGMSFMLALGAHGQDQRNAQACTRLGDDAARLSCYDAAFGVSKPPTTHQSDVGKTEALEKFGDGGALHPRPQTNPPKNITAQVHDATSLAYGLYRLTLDNGQVWRTTESDSEVEFKANDTVTISRRVLGGYAVSLTGRNASVNAIRIK
jgi:hypothetical protein